MKCVCSPTIFCTPCKMRAHQERISNAMLLSSKRARLHVRNKMEQFDEDEYDNPSSFHTGNELPELIWFHTDNDWPMGLGAETHDPQAYAPDKIPASQHSKCIAYEVARNIEEYHSDPMLYSGYSLAVY